MHCELCLYVRVSVCHAECTSIYQKGGSWTLCTAAVIRKRRFWGSVSGQYEFDPNPYLDRSFASILQYGFK